MPDLRRAPTYAAPDAVAEAARDMPDTYLECRDYAHAWRPLSASRTPTGFVRVRQCSRCHTERHEELSQHGGIVSSHYTYPDGYLLSGLGRIAGDSRDALRLASIVRTIEHNQIAGGRRRRKAS